MNKDIGKIVIRLPGSPHRLGEDYHEQRYLHTCSWPEMWWTEPMWDNFAKKHYDDTVFKIGNVVRMSAETIGPIIKFNIDVDVTNLDVRHGEGTLLSIYSLFKLDGLCEYVQINMDSPSRNRITLSIRLLYGRMIYEHPLDPEKSSVEG